MTDGRCPTELELDRAFTVGLDPDLRTHLGDCASCRTLWDETCALIELARDLPLDVATARQREEGRTALLAAAAGPGMGPSVVAAPTREPAVPAPVASEHARGGRARQAGPVRWAVPVVVAAVAAAVVGWMAARERPRPRLAITHPRRGVVHPHDGARFTLAAQPPDELVRLRDGVIDVDVEPLAPGERFRVVIGADEIEVHGTSFEVVAAADRLVAVHVVHGRVEVRTAGAAPVFLLERETWPVVGATVALSPVAGATDGGLAPVPVRRPAVKRPAPALDTIAPPPPPSRSEAPQEVAFVGAWAAMRQDEFGAAALGFARALALAPDGPLAEDATFWHAVAVARLHRTGDAVTALRAFVAAFPASPRAGQASAMLGWLLVETHEPDEAARRFLAAEHDANLGARSSARAGLEALRRQAD